MLLPSVTFVIMFNEMLLHITSICILLRWNKLKKLGLGLLLGLVHLVHWTQSDGEKCLKVDICHHLNESSALDALDLSLTKKTKTTYFKIN